MDKHISQFTAYLKERNLSQHTIKVYGDNLKEFQRYLGKRKIGTARREHIRGFLFVLNEKNNQPITRRAKLTTIKSFFKYLEEENAIKSNPAKNLPLPKVPIKEPEYLSEAELKKLIHIVQQDKSKYKQRNELLIKILIETGIRISELTNLNIGDIDCEAKTITIIRKGGQKQSLPINTELANKTKGLIKGRNSNEPLLVSSYKKRITQRRVGLLVQKYLKLAGITKPNISVHSLRHSFCSRLLEKGVNLKAIQILAGHKNIQTTERYLHIAKTRLRKEVRLARI